MTNDKQPKLKVGIVCYPSIGGSGIVASQLGHELAALGHQVHFISYDPPFRLNLKEPNVFFHKVLLNEYSLFKYPDYTLPLSVRMVEVSDKYKLDIMHVHYAVPHATAGLLAKSIANNQHMLFPHLITTLHGTDITLLGRDQNLMPVIKYSIENSCGVTAVSQSLKVDTLKTLKTTKAIEVIHNFYNPKKPFHSIESVRKTLHQKADFGSAKVSDSDFLAIHLSNLRPVKRIPDLLSIMGRLKSHSSIKLLILAGGDFKPYEKLANKLKIQNKLVVINNVLDIENYINAADIGIYTSSEESFGMGVLESMAYGKPVLASKVGGIPEFMDNGKSGYLFKTGDIAAYAKKLIALSKDRQLVRVLGHWAKQRASTGFSSHVIVHQYIDFYRKIIKECKGNFK